MESCTKISRWMESDSLTSVTEVRKAHIRRWLDELLSQVSAQTARRHYSGARQWFTWLHEQVDLTGC
jgi:site-specific recombinase XerD